MMQVFLSITKTSLHMHEAILHVGQLRFRCALGCHFCEEGFNCDASFDQAEEVFRTKQAAEVDGAHEKIATTFGDVRSISGSRGDEAEQAKRLESLAYRRAAYLKHFCELRLRRQFLTRLESPSPK